MSIDLLSNYFKDMPAPNQNLFAEFPPVSKEQWYAKIEKDLKGRALSDLDWLEIAPLSITTTYFRQTT